MLTPAVMHALVAAGATAAMLAAAFEADFNERHAPQRDATLHATDATFSTGEKPKTSTERSRDYRAKQRASRIQRDAVASVSPLSLDLSLKGQNGNDGRMPVTAGWKPDSQSLGTAVKEGQDPEALAANFRDHYAARPQDMRTPAQWQATYRKWARSERKGAGSAQGQLPLMRRVRDGPGKARPSLVEWEPKTDADYGWQPGMPTSEEMRQKWRVADG